MRGLLTAKELEVARFEAIHDSESAKLFEHYGFPAANNTALNAVAVVRALTTTLSAVLYASAWFLEHVRLHART